MFSPSRPAFNPVLNHHARLLEQYRQQGLRHPVFHHAPASLPFAAPNHPLLSPPSTSSAANLFNPFTHVAKAAAAELAKKSADQLGASDKSPLKEETDKDVEMKARLSDDNNDDSVEVSPNETKSSDLTMNSSTDELAKLTHETMIKEKGSGDDEKDNSEEQQREGEVVVPASKTTPTSAAISQQQHNNLLESSRNALMNRLNYIEKQSLLGRFSVYAPETPTISPFMPIHPALINPQFREAMLRLQTLTNNQE